MGFMGFMGFWAEQVSQPETDMSTASERQAAPEAPSVAAPPGGGEPSWCSSGVRVPYGFARRAVHVGLHYRDRRCREMLCQMGGAA